MTKGGYIYILSNQHNTTLYIGVTSNLVNRVYEHKTKRYSNSFSAKYNLNKIIYYEFFASIAEAINRERYLKSKKRNYKEQLINSINSEWKDLWYDIQDCI
ncbi:MAG: GIY-YIG nuclease family protein [Chitinophagales bacterium]|nr:GIY-YIG nuclease family protein [Chitinophagales bacterium]